MSNPQRWLGVALPLVMLVLVSACGLWGLFGASDAPTSLPSHGPTPAPTSTLLPTPAPESLPEAIVGAWAAEGAGFGPGGCMEFFSEGTCLAYSGEGEDGWVLFEMFDYEFVEDDVIRVEPLRDESGDYWYSEYLLEAPAIARVSRPAEDTLVLRFDGEAALGPVVLRYKRPLLAPPSRPMEQAILGVWEADPRFSPYLDEGPPAVLEFSEDGYWILLQYEDHELFGEIGEYRFSGPDEMNIASLDDPQEIYALSRATGFRIPAEDRLTWWGTVLQRKSTKKPPSSADLPQAIVGKWRLRGPHESVVKEFFSDGTVIHTADDGWLQVEEYEFDGERQIRVTVPEMPDYEWSAHVFITADETRLLVADEYEVNVLTRED